MRHQNATTRTDRPLYFLHIPKTAGVSLTTLLKARFDPTAVCPAQLWSELLHLSRERLGRYRLFHGHFYWHLLADLPQAPACVTFLRNPIERALSHYEHILRDPGHYLHRKARAQRGLRDFLTDPETRPMIVNFQTRALALDLNPRALAAGLSRTELRGLALERLLESALPAMPDEELLRVAKRRLATCAFVGVVERFEESVTALCDTFGWPRVDCPRLNTSPNRTDRRALSPDVLDLLREQTCLDALLYQHALDLFAAHLPVPA